MQFETLARKIGPLPDAAVQRLALPPASQRRAIPRIHRRRAHTETEPTSSAPSSSHAPPTSSAPQPGGPGSISDHEWNLRAGRAVYTLRTTLPRFFETGLVSNVDPSPEAPDKRAKSRHGDSIYAPNIKLSYSPPASLSLPSPFPKSLQVEGLPLYHASATFIRHTLSAFNTDLHVELRKLQVQSAGARHREITIRKGVSGKSRISGTRNEWDVHSTYRLSPHSGLVESHVVESIHPAPHVTFYDGLRAALARLAGVDVGREAGAGVRGFTSDRSLESIPLREESRTNEKD